MPEEQRILCGRYALGRPLGAGGMGCVWEAEHCATGRRVAVKVLSRELAGNSAAAARFHTEARAAARLNSKHIVQIFDHDVDPVVGPFIAMELLPGESLAQRLSRTRTIHPVELANLVSQVAKGLCLAHEAGIIHRDLKPDNMFLAVDEDRREIVKILDFGVAKTPLAAGAGLTVDGYLVGTLAYMSPEQALGRTVDHRSDLWALGIIAFEALIGQLPFLDSNPIAQAMAICHSPIPVPSQLKSSLPAGFDAWFQVATQRDVSLRFQSAAALASALAEVCAPAHLRDPHALSQQDVDRISASGDTPGKYYVMSAEITVGPICGAVLRAGILCGRVPPTALVWTQGWEEWRSASDLTLELESMAPEAPALLLDKPGVEALGARSMLPLSAPPPSSVRGSIPPESVGLSKVREPAISYFVSDGEKTVGPVRPSLVRRGLEADCIPSDAMVWRKGWNEWRPIHDVRTLFDHASPPVSESLQGGGGIECMGPPSCLPADAPPTSRRATGTLPIGWNDPAGKAPAIASFYVTNESLTVGPVTGSLLLRGIQAGRVPLSAQVWTDGWSKWRAAGEVLPELHRVPSTPTERLRDAEGIEALGPVSLRPDRAPSSFST